VRYINNQERHHRRMTWDEEFAKMLEKHGIKPFTSRGIERAWD
jgi:hypothetical protein